MKKELTFFMNTDIIKNGHSKSSVDPWFWCNLQKCREVFRDVCCYMLSFQIVCCFHCLLFSLFAVFIWRVSEVVVTRRTRNAVVRKGTWVRIPHSPLLLHLSACTGFIMQFYNEVCSILKLQLLLSWYCLTTSGFTCIIPT